MKANGSSQSVSVLMRTCRALFILLVLSLLALLIHSCVMLKREKQDLLVRVEYLQKEMMRVRGDLNTNDRQLSQISSQFKDVQKLYGECKNSFRDATNTGNTLKSQSDTFQQKVNDLEKQLKDKEDYLKKLALTISAGSAPAGISNNIQPQGQGQNQGQNQGQVPQAQPGQPPQQAVNQNVAAQPNHAACQRWNIQMDTNSVGGVLMVQLRTLPECMNYCISFPSCVVVDFDNRASADKSCWIHTSPAGIHAKDNYMQIGTHQYRLNRNCNKPELTYENMDG